MVKLDQDFFITIKSVTILDVDLDDDTTAVIIQEEYAFHDVNNIVSAAGATYFVSCGIFVE